MFILADRGSGETYVHPAKTANESTIRLLLLTRQQESVTVYTDGFRAYEPLDEDDAFDREYVVHGGGEYADGEVHVNTYESHASLARQWLSPHRGISKDKLTPYLRALQLRKRVRRKTWRRSAQNHPRNSAMTPPTIAYPRANVLLVCPQQVDSY